VSHLSGPLCLICHPNSCLWSLVSYLLSFVSFPSFLVCGLVSILSHSLSPVLLFLSCICHKLSPVTNFLSLVSHMSSFAFGPPLLVFDPLSFIFHPLSPVPNFLSLSLICHPLPHLTHSLSLVSGLPSPATLHPYLVSNISTLLPPH